jgi:hypothetical protein
MTIFYTTFYISCIIAYVYFTVTIFYITCGTCNTRYTISYFITNFYTIRSTGTGTYTGVITGFYIYINCTWSANNVTIFYT